MLKLNKLIRQWMLKSLEEKLLAVSEDQHKMPEFFSPEIIDLTNITSS